MAEIENLKVIQVGPLQVNCYLYWDAGTRETFIIDPGAEAELILHLLKRDNLKAKYIINTHGHFDHVGANAELRKRLGVPLAAHGKDAGLLADAHEHAVIFGVKMARQPAPDILLEEGAALAAGSLTLGVLHTPGHTRGGICLYEQREGLLFTGDTLFAGSIGRTDFEGGSFEELMNSIKTKVLTLDDSVRVLPGHGPASTVGEERETNQFLAGA